MSVGKSLECHHQISARIFLPCFSRRLSLTLQALVHHCSEDLLQNVQIGNLLRVIRLKMSLALLRSKWYLIQFNSLIRFQLSLITLIMSASFSHLLPSIKLSCIKLHCMKDQSCCLELFVGVKLYF